MYIWLTCTYLLLKLGVPIVCPFRIFSFFVGETSPISVYTSNSTHDSVPDITPNSIPNITPDSTSDSTTNSTTNSQ